MAKKTIEQLAKEIYNDYLGTEDEVTLEEAKEMAEMELGAKENVKTYVKSDKSVNRKKTVRERKVDTKKSDILNMLTVGLKESNIDFEIHNENKITFVLDSESYTVNLIRHRNKWRGASPFLDTRYRVSFFIPLELMGTNWVRLD